jgi:hypothetical protein
MSRTAPGSTGRGLWSGAIPCCFRSGRSTASYPRLVALAAGTLIGGALPPPPDAPHGAMPAVQAARGHGSQARWVWRADGVAGHLWIDGPTLGFPSPVDPTAQLDLDEEMVADLRFTDDAELLLVTPRGGWWSRGRIDIAPGEVDRLRCHAVVPWRRDGLVTVEIAGRRPIHLWVADIRRLRAGADRHRCATRLGSRWWQRRAGVTSTHPRLPAAAGPRGWSGVRCAGSASVASLRSSGIRWTRMRSGARWRTARTSRCMPSHPHLRCPANQHLGQRGIPVASATSATTSASASPCTSTSLTLPALRGELSADLRGPAFGGAHGLERQRFELRSASNSSRATGPG